MACYGNAEAGNTSQIVVRASRLHVSGDDILALIRRHPYSLQDIACDLSIPCTERIVVQ